MAILRQKLGQLALAHIASQDQKFSSCRMAGPPLSSMLHQLCQAGGGGEWATAEKKTYLTEKMKKNIMILHNDDENNHEKSVIFTGWRGVPT